MAALVHRDFADKLKSARIWGTGVFDGQTVGRDHVLHDKDVVELHIDAQFADACVRYFPLGGLAHVVFRNGTAHRGDPVR